MSWLRPRWPYLLAIVLVIPLGLSTRSSAVPWPAFVVAHGGDALYASMSYLGFRMLRPRARPWVALGFALAFCFTIEFFQLVHTPWVDGIRDTLFGRLVLGSGFLWIDLVRYVAGATGAWGIDVAVIKRARSR